jgi:hypothetical protein
MIWRCFAPLFLQLSLFVGKGIFIKDPLNNGLHETKLIFRFSQVYNKDPPY